MYFSASHNSITVCSFSVQFPDKTLRGAREPRDNRSPDVKHHVPLITYVHTPGCIALRSCRHNHHNWAGVPLPRPTLLPPLFELRCTVHDKGASPEDGEMYASMAREQLNGARESDDEDAAVAAGAKPVLCGTRRQQRVRADLMLTMLYDMLGQYGESDEYLNAALNVSVSVGGSKEFNNILHGLEGMFLPGGANGLFCFVFTCYVMCDDDLLGACLKVPVALCSW